MHIYHITAVYIQRSIIFYEVFMKERKMIVRGIIRAGICHVHIYVSYVCLYAHRVINRVVGTILTPVGCEQ